MADIIGEDEQQLIPEKLYQSADETIEEVPHRESIIVE